MITEARVSRAATESQNIPVECPDVTIPKVTYYVLDFQIFRKFSFVKKL